jgi:hypothetical protein
MEDKLTACSIRRFVTMAALDSRWPDTYYFLFGVRERAYDSLQVQPSLVDFEIILDIGTVLRVPNRMICRNLQSSIG